MIRLFYCCSVRSIASLLQVSALKSNSVEKTLSGSSFSLANTPYRPAGVISSYRGVSPCCTARNVNLSDSSLILRVKVIWFSCITTK